MKNQKKLIPISVTVLFGAAMWVAFWLVSGRHDPQASVSYWSNGYPMMFGGSILFGYLFPEGAWKWGLYIVGTQLFLALFILPGDLNLLPIGLAVQVIISIPLVIGSYVGVWLSKRKRSERPTRGSIRPPGKIGRTGQPYISRYAFSMRSLSVQLLSNGE